MITNYSKTAGDLSQENALLSSDDEHRKKQKKLVEKLEQYPLRQQCLCCSEKLNGVQFTHHGPLYTECSCCSHIQTSNQPSSDYPHAIVNGNPFSMVYPSLDTEAYKNRCERIYKPKLDWIFSVLLKLGHSETALLDKKWLEIGSGAGYFLSAANKKGIKNIVGLEVDEQLVDISKKSNPDVLTQLWNHEFETALDKSAADIYCSFFVLEHVSNLFPVWKSLKSKPSGTIFAFSVPVFGFSCLLEQAFPNDYARNLEGVVHTQMFTESSINYGLKLAGYKIIGEWIFGQDIMDLSRLLNNAANKNLKNTLIYSSLSKDLQKAVDALQGALDKNRLADQRHLLAVRV